VMHAMEEAYPMLAAYDLVVHLHPDVLVYDCEALEVFCPWVGETTQEKKQDGFFLCLQGGRAHPLAACGVCPSALVRISIIGNVRRMVKTELLKPAL
jgi:hypothetical protein